ncbi:MAG: RNA 2',3'-cyclic phosphodiesterase [Thermoanaerobaculia bacterium]|nr:RNA 2',3'-cyclic phosphodiesterase [Thermoanaerobaculia bacterium]
MRLFIASSFPEAATRELNHVIASLRPRLPKASWVRPEAMHLTYVFLGDRMISPSFDGIAPFKARLRGCGFFPNRSHARVGWIGVEPEEPFIEIAGRVEAENDFRPHLTITRIRDRWPEDAIDAFEADLHDFRSEFFVVDTVTLYSSELKPGGAVHTPMSEFVLTESGG